MANRLTRHDKHFRKILFTLALICFVCIVMFELAEIFWIYILSEWQKILSCFPGLFLLIFLNLKLILKILFGQNKGLKSVPC